MLESLGRLAHLPEEKGRGISLFLRAGLTWTILGSVIALLYWAYRAEIDSVVRGFGQVIPDSSTQIVQSLEGGIIAELPVTEGQRIEKNQVLVRIQDKQFAAQYNENISIRDALRARIVRLNAEGTGATDPVFPEETLAARPDLVAKEIRLFEARRLNLQAQIVEIRDQLESARKKFEAVRPSIDSGAISMTERIDMESKISELTNRLNVVETGFRREALELLDQETARLAALEETLPADRDRLDRADIRSPVSGIVNAIYIKTVGRVVKSGDPIMEIVPENESLLVEAKLRPSDIAFVYQGGEAKVRFTAYDFATYGGLIGTVETIGADTVSGPEGEEFYPIKVRTQGDSLGADRKTGKALKLVPGMIAEVDIVTGKRTILEYLLKPIHRARQKAMREK